MTEKRFQWIYIKDNILELQDNGIVKIFNNKRLEELLNDLVEENEQLKSENKELIELIRHCYENWSEEKKKIVGEISNGLLGD